MGYKNLYGIEIQDYALKLCKKRAENIQIIQGSAFNIPFKNKFFDLVFTSGLLIHIAPADIDRVLQEIFRCTRKFIWGFEYFADDYTEVKYRGKSNLLWKTNFSQLYLNLFKNLELVKEQRLKYLSNENTDIMFLLEKNGKKH